MGGYFCCLVLIFVRYFFSQVKRPRLSPQVDLSLQSINYQIIYLWKFL
jgi:hypothetical protein